MAGKQDFSKKSVGVSRKAGKNREAGKISRKEHEWTGNSRVAGAERSRKQKRSRKTAEEQKGAERSEKSRLEQERAEEQKGAARGRKWWEGAGKNVDKKEAIRSRN
jgi:hypothetical protein